MGIREARLLVRSAYRFLKQDQTAKARATTNEQSDSGSGCWGAVWKLNVPPKIRVFWWRVLHNSLPSKHELHRRHVAHESYCEMCGDPSESLYHVFFTCPMARRFWREIKKLVGMSVPNLHPCSWTTDVLCREVCSPILAATIVCGAWCLWTGRNARRHGRKTWEPGATARYISSLLEDLASLKTPPTPGVDIAVARWSKPEAFAG